MSDDATWQCVRPQGHEGPCRFPDFYGPPGFFQNECGICVRLDRVLAYEYRIGDLDVWLVSRAEPLALHCGREELRMFERKLLAALNNGGGRIVLTTETKEDVHGEDLSERGESRGDDGQ